jgi:hypothetical protein
VDSLTIALVSLVCIAVGVAIGTFSRQRVPEHHIVTDSRDVIRLAMGLIATLVALVLSLLISSSSSFYNSVEAEYREALASLRQLDNRLKSYGPDAQPARLLLRAAAAQAFKERWPDGDFGPVPNQPVTHEALERSILDLRPLDGAQKWYQERSLELVERLDHIQNLVRGQSRSRSLPVPLLVVVLASAAVIFGSWGLFVTPNGTVLSAIAVAALAVAAAIFLIVELNSPFAGLLQLPGQPAEALVQTLAR